MVASALKAVNLNYGYHDVTEPTREELLGAEDKPTKRIIKSCKTCWHREGSECPRVGVYCSTEMLYGGRCNKDGKLVLWEPRPTLFEKLFGWLL